MKVDLCLNPRVFTREEVLSKIPQMREIMERRAVHLAYLFGSIVDGLPGSLSDVDIAVLPDPKSYHWLETYNDIYGDLCQLFRADNIDVMMLNEAPPPFRFAAVKTGLPIYVKDAALQVGFEEEVIFVYQDTKPLREEHWYFLRQHVKEGLTKAMRKINGSKVRRFIGKMDEAVVRLKGFSSVSEAEFLEKDNWQIRSLVEHLMRIAIEAAIDAGRHIIVAKGWGLPEEYKDVGRLLRENGVVPQELGDKLVAMAGLRNILVHLYWDVDYRRLYQALTSQLSDFDEYARCIFDFVAKERGEE